MAFVTGQGKSLGENISTIEAEDFIFGLCIFNIIRGETYKNMLFHWVLFLGKSFASSISLDCNTRCARLKLKTEGEKMFLSFTTFQFAEKKIMT